MNLNPQSKNKSQKAIVISDSRGEGLPGANEWGYISMQSRLKGTVDLQYEWLSSPGVF